VAAGVEPALQTVRTFRPLVEDECGERKRGEGTLARLPVFQPATFEQQWEPRQLSGREQLQSGSSRKPSTSAEALSQSPDERGRLRRSRSERRVRCKALPRHGVSQRALANVNLWSSIQLRLV